MKVDISMCSLQAQANTHKFMTVGAFSYGQPLIIRSWRGLNCCIEDNKLTIGKFCSLADSIEVFMGGNHMMNWITTFSLGMIGINLPLQVGNNGDINIENDVWIGSQATIMSGVTIGNGACIGAKTVVAKNIPPYSIAVGNPARVVRKRFDDASIEKLLTIKWWDWHIVKIQQAGTLLASGNVQGLVEFHEKVK